MALRKMAADLVNFAKDNSLTDNASRYNPIYYNRALEAMRRFRSGPEEAELTAGEMLQRTLSRARETEYGRRYGTDLTDWPILTKSEVLADPLNFRRPGTFAIPAATSGSTGSPLPLWRSLECISAEQAFIDSILDGDQRSMLERRVAVLRADHVKRPEDLKPPFGVWRNRRRRLVLSSAHLTRATLPWFVETLTSFRPEVLWVYPSALSTLLRLCEDAGTGLSVPVVLSSSEMLSDSLFHYASQALQARVVDHYGQAERVCIAHCDTVREYRFDPAYGHVELFPDPGRRPGEPVTARIIATGYWNSAFPLVRYDTGDRVVMPIPVEADGPDRRELEQTANGRLSFPGIIGRADDYITGQDGEKIIGINHIPRELEAVLRVQIVQESETMIKALVLSRGPLSAKDRRTLERNAEQILPSYMEVEIEAVNELTCLPNGKTPFIIRRTDVL